MLKKISASDYYLHNLVFVSRVEFESFSRFFQRKAMADQAVQIHSSALGQVDGARVGVLHAATHDNREPFATRRGSFQFKPVAAGDADHYQTPTEARHFRGLGYRFVRPSGFNRH